MSTTPVKKKRGPGRPKKIVEKKVIPRSGILDEPITKEVNSQLQHILEVYYDQPMVIKKIFNLFKAEATTDIKISFRRDKVVFVAQDFKKKSYIYDEILGEKINGYYVEEPFEVGLKPMDAQKAMNTINKDYVSIMIWSNRLDKGQKLHFTLHNDKYEDDTDHEVDVQKDPIKFPDDIDQLIILESEYPITFELDTKYFKKKIVDAATLADKMKIEKNGEEPLTLSYQYESKAGRSKNPFKNPKKINLVSTIGPDDMFSTSFYLSYVKPLAGALISDVIQISAHKSHRLIFTAHLDRKLTGKVPIPGTESCRVKVLTEVIDLRSDMRNL